MSDYENDARREKWLEEKDAIKESMRDYCYRDCEYHKTLVCDWYDPEEETWDFEECFKTKGW